MPRVSRKGGNFLSRVNASSGRQELTGAGHEALHCSEAGDPTASDTEICAFVREYGHVVLTNDPGFPQSLAHTRQSGPSVLLRGEPLIPETRGAALLQALQGWASDLARGAIVSLDWSGPTRAKFLQLNTSR
jgi:predicted nuclease of predicted toxin-antitoxin system